MISSSRGVSWWMCSFLLWADSTAAKMELRVLLLVAGAPPPAPTASENREPDGLSSTSMS